VKNNSDASARNGRRRRAAVGIALALLVVYGGYRGILRIVRPPPPEYPFHMVAEGPLVINVLDNGSIESREKIAIKSQVEGRSTIVFLVDEGAIVKKGDLLVELDSSKLKESEHGQNISVQNAEAGLLQARESLAIATNQAQADIEKAELDLKFARMDLQKYIDGDYPMEQQKAESAITLAREELQKARDQHEWSEKLADKSYLTRTELQADALAVKRNEIDVQTAESTLGLLTNFTYRRQVEQFSSAVKQAEMALERVKRKARADVVKAEVDARAKESEYQQQKLRLEKIQAQIVNCRIAAPADGMVIYATSGSSRRWGSNNEPLRVGGEIGEREDLIYLPTTQAMNAELKIPESSLAKIREGMRAFVTVDALPGRMFHGRLARIGILPDTTMSWLNPDLKVYNCVVDLDTAPPELRPGMSCKVEILIEEWPKALSVPVQCVMRVNGKPSVYVIGHGKPILRPVEIGLDNNVMIHILSGLTPGEKVWLTPPLAEATREERAPPQMRLDGPVGTNRPPPAMRGDGAARPGGRPGGERPDRPERRGPPGGGGAGPTGPEGRS
jgi:HlyD family secretion protein